MPYTSDDWHIVPELAVAEMEAGEIFRVPLPGAGDRIAQADGRRR